MVEPRDESVGGQRFGVYGVGHRRRTRGRVKILEYGKVNKLVGDFNDGKLYGKTRLTLSPPLKETL